MWQKSKIIKAKLNEESVCIRQKSFNSSSKKPLDWLKEQKEVYPQFFWRCKKKSTTYAGTGSLISLKEPPDLKNSKDLLFFGGGSFHESQYPWQNFPETYYFLPVRLFISKTTTTIEQENTLLSPFSSDAIPFLCQASIDDSSNGYIPSFEEWKKTTLKALKSIEQGQLQKVVNARLYVEKKGKEVDPYALLEKLMEANKTASFFFFSPQKGYYFLGASPEMLYVKKGSALYIDVVASTKKLKESHLFDKAQKKRLLTHPKDTKEFSLVKEEFLRILAPFANKVRFYKKDKILQSANLIHRFNYIKALLKKEMSNKELIHLLHPSPAISGLSREKALAFIQSHEKFSRGWYASPIGIFKEKTSEVAVAIRSALIAKNTSFLFSATGIVEGSTPSSEWDELESKISLIKGLI